MKRLLKILILFVLIMVSFQMTAQINNDELTDTLENKILYNKQRTYGVVFHNLGFGVNFRTGKRLSIFKTRMLEFEFVSMKGYNQIYLVTGIPDAKRFIYGKLNDAFFLRANVIWKKLLNRKPYWGGVEVRWVYGGGFSLGIGKPYYLYVLKDEDGDGKFSTIVAEKYDPQNHGALYIYGKAPFSKGLDEINLHPGINIKTGLNFEFGTRNTKIKSIEIGGSLDILPTGLSIMYSSENQVFFPTVYLNFSFGQRYNKY